MRFHPEIAHGNQALALQPIVRHSGLGGQRPRQVPVSFATEPGSDSLPFARPRCQQLTHLGARFAPLLPETYPYLSTQPAVSGIGR